MPTIRNCFLPGRSQLHIAFRKVTQNQQKIISNAIHIQNGKVCRHNVFTCTTLSKKVNEVRTRSGGMLRGQRPRCLCVQFIQEDPWRTLQPSEANSGVFLCIILLKRFIKGETRARLPQMAYLIVNPNASLCIAFSRLIKASTRSGDTASSLFVGDT